MMTDDHLIGYCEIHCQTERALFSEVQVNRMIELAGFPKDFARSVPKGWYSLHEEMQELCNLAKAQKGNEDGNK